MPLPPSDLAVNPQIAQTTSETDANERLRGLRERIDALIERLGQHRVREAKATSQPCDNADELRIDLEQALAECGYGPSDVAPIAEAAIDLVGVAVADQSRSNGPISRLQAFEIAIATGGADDDRTFRAGIAPVGDDQRRVVVEARSAGNGERQAEFPPPKARRVALRGARRSLLRDGGAIVRLRFTAVFS
jgi:hypothetical protein